MNDQNIVFMESTQEILNILKFYKQQFAAKYGIERLGLFGSVARGEQDDNSDIDVVIKMQRPSLFRSYRIREELETLFRRKVDLITLHENQSMSEMGVLDRLRCLTIKAEQAILNY